VLYLNIGINNTIFFRGLSNNSGYLFFWTFFFLTIIVTNCIIFGLFVVVVVVGEECFNCFFSVSFLSFYLFTFNKNICKSNLDTFLFYFILVLCHPFVVLEPKLLKKKSVLLMVVKARVLLLLHYYMASSSRPRLFFFSY
jgi:hypothetical protein